MKKFVAYAVSITIMAASTGMAIAGDGATVFKKKCKACHNITDKKKVGPGLQGVLGSTSEMAGKLDEAGLNTWLDDPKKVNSKAKMPKLKLKDADKAAVIEYLKTL